jgi:hypothetical protein
MPTISFFISDKCSGIIRTPGVPITTLDGRLRGKDISFNTTSYEEYKMRRKAEVLQYKTIETIYQTKKTEYANIVNNGKSYSQAQLKKLANTQQQNCPIVSYPATNSGVNAEYKMKYYYNTNIRYLPSL